MSKVFKIRPKRIKRVNGTVLTPDMEVIVTTSNHQLLQANQTIGNDALSE